MTQFKSQSPKISGAQQMHSSQLSLAPYLSEAYLRNESIEMISLRKRLRGGRQHSGLAQKEAKLNYAAMG